MYNSLRIEKLAKRFIRERPRRQIRRQTRDYRREERDMKGRFGDKAAGILAEGQGTAGQVAAVH
jgi:hypothetical protein